MKKFRFVIPSIIISTLIIFLLLWFTGFLPLWLNGVTYVANNTNKYSLTHEDISGQFFVTINLSDLDGNKGELIYNDGKNKIEIDWVDKVNGVYRVGFRTIGNYTLSGAEVVSGVQHLLSSRGFSSTIVATAAIEYNGHEYSLAQFANGPMDRQGDYFAFYLSSDDVFENGELAFDENGKVELIISGLCKNIWKRK